jgi:diacylglycerol kinase family enzyme
MSSFAYVFDLALGQGIANKDRDRIQTEIARIGIQGPEFFGGFHDVEGGLEEALKQGVKNVILIGPPAWHLSWLPWSLRHPGITMGYISPEPSVLGRALGMSQGAQAIPLIAARVLRVLDVGTINKRPFLLEAAIQDTRAKLTFEGTYSISGREPSPLAIRNFALQPKTGDVLSDPYDGQLEAVIHTKREAAAFFGMWKRTELEETKVLFQKGVIRDLEDQSLHIAVDGQGITAREASFEVLPRALSVIVGPDRLFS